MKDKEIIDAARLYEQSSEFSDIVHRAKGVNSAAGIGYLEGAVWMKKQLVKRLSAMPLDKAVKYIVTTARDGESDIMTAVMAYIDKNKANVEDVLYQSETPVLGSVYYYVEDGYSHAIIWTGCQFDIDMYLNDNCMKIPILEVKKDESRI